MSDEPTGEEMGKVKRHWHELYVEMLANPMDSRTDKQFCAEIQLNESTLKFWKHRYSKAIYSEVQKRRKDFINEMRARAYKALGKKMDKDTNALKLALQITGDLVERSEVKAEMTHDDKLRRINNLLDRIGKKKTVWTASEGTEGLEGSDQTDGAEHGPTPGESPSASGTDK